MKESQKRRLETAAAAGAFILKVCNKNGSKNGVVVSIFYKLDPF